MTEDNIKALPIHIPNVDKYFELESLIDSGISWDYKYKQNVLNAMLDFKENYIGKLGAVHKVIIDFESRSINYIGIDYKNDPLSLDVPIRNKILINDELTAVIMYLYDTHGSNLTFSQIQMVLTAHLKMSESDDYFEDSEFHSTINAAKHFISEVVQILDTPNVPYGLSKFNNHD